MSRALIPALLVATLAAPVAGAALPLHAATAARAAGSDVRRLTLRSESALTRDGHAHFLAWNPRGDHLLYLDSGALWLSDTVGRRRQRLVSSGVADAAFAADGTHVLYQAVTAGSQPQPNGIVRIDLQGHGARRVAGADYFPVYAGVGAFSDTSLAGSVLRDGRLALERNGKLYALDPRSGALASLGSFVLPAASEVGALPTTAAAISPDGAHVAVFGLSNGLVIQDVRGGRVSRRVVPASGQAVGGTKLQPSAVSWSPDSHTLIYELGGSPGPGALMATDTRTGRQWTLLRVQAETLSGLTWSPSGAMVAFSDVSASTNVPTLSEIKLVNANGSGLRTLDPGAARAGWLAKYQPGQLSPVWSPSGRAIGYTRVSSPSKGNAVNKTDAWLASLAMK